MLKEIKDKFNPNLPNCPQKKRHRWGRKASPLQYPAARFPESMLNIGNVSVTSAFSFHPNQRQTFNCTPCPLSQRNVAEQEDPSVAYQLHAADEDKRAPAAAITHGFRDPGRSQTVPRRPPSSPHFIQSDRGEGPAAPPRARGLRAAAASVLGSDRH